MAGRKMEDDVTDETKARRLQEIVDLQQKHAWSRSEEFIGQTVEVLVEKVSKKSTEEFSGRNSQSITVVFPKENYKIGDFVNVKIISCTSGTLKGEPSGLSAMN
ncbi:MAG: tRNA-2-methylthio-N6-dimethylallyladenosine synthase [Flavobacterium sp.]